MRGRSFTERDNNGPPVAIISESVAKQFWPDTNPHGPLDQQIVFDRPYKIIGVVADVRDNALSRDPRPDVYSLNTQSSDKKVVEDIPLAWVIRARVPPASLIPAIENELREASGGLPVAHFRTMDEVVSLSTSTESFNALVLAIFASTALLLAGVGVYGLMAYSVSERIQEFGIRMALGARPSDLIKGVLVHGLRPVLLGLIVGLLAAGGLTRFIAGLLFGVKPLDPLLFLLTPILLAAVAVIAALRPALRASRVDPMEALGNVPA